MLSKRWRRFQNFEVNRESLSLTILSGSPCNLYTVSNINSAMSDARYVCLDGAKCTIDVNRSIMTVRSMVFFKTFLFVFHHFLRCFTFSTLFSICFTHPEKTIRVLLIPRRSRAQRTTTTDDPFQALSKRPSLRVVLQVHLSFGVPRNLPQQDVSLFTR